MEYLHEIERALKQATGLDVPPDRANKFIADLRKIGLGVMPIPEKQVHDVDRLILAEKIVATRRNIQKMRATEVFENHGALVKTLDADVNEYFETYVVSGEGLGDV